LFWDDIVHENNAK